MKGHRNVAEGTRSYDQNTETIKVKLKGNEIIYDDVYQLNTSEVISLYSPYYGAVIKLLIILSLLKEKESIMV